MKNMNDKIQKSLEMAKKLGAVQIDIITQGANTFSLKAEKGELSEYKKANSNTLGVRVIKDNKVGISYTEATDDDSIKTTIQNAIINAKYSKEDNHQSICAGENKVTDKRIENNCEHIPSVDEMIEKTLYLEDEVLKREKLTKNSPYNGVGHTKSNFIIANSNNVFCEYESQTFSCYTSALLTENGKNSMHYYADLSRDFRTLDFEKCIDESLLVAKNLLHAGQIKTGKYHTSFDLEVFEDLFNSFLVMLSAKSVIDKTNPWAKKLGQKVIDSRLSIIDDPFFERGFTTIPFDSEGFKKQKNTFVENGTLKEFIHNSATAKELNMKNNFCASRSPRSPLAASTSNIIFSPGSDSLKSINSTNHIEITGAQGLHSGVNSLTGDFSLGVSGRIINDGEIKQYFKDVTISGNFYEMLSRISHISDELLNSPNNTFFAPKIVFEDLFIAGN